MSESRDQAQPPPSRFWVGAYCTRAVRSGVPLSATYQGAAAEE